MAIPNSVREASLDINVALTNVAQGYFQPDFCMRTLFPLVEVGTDNGIITRFDDSIFEEIDDDRADDTFYPEVQDGYSGQAFELNTKGFSYRVGDKKARQSANLGVNWAIRAQRRMMERAMLQHEIEGAVRATNFAGYHTDNRIALTAGNQFNDTNVNPGTVIREGRAAISVKTGKDPNVMILGRRVFDAMAENPFLKDRIQYTSRESVTEEILAGFYGFDKVKVCNAIVKRNGQTERVFGNHLLLAYTNPAGLNQERIGYRPTGTIDNETPSMGYTYTYLNNPLAYSPYYDKARKATVYQLDFDRSVELTGTDSNGDVTHGYFVQDAVA